MIPYGSLAVTVDVGTVVATAAHAWKSPVNPQRTPRSSPPKEAED